MYFPFFLCSSLNEIPLHLVDGLATLEGKQMNCMTWLGMLLRMDFVRIVCHVMLSNLDFHPASLFLILSSRNWKSLSEGLLWKIGKPKYLPKALLTCIWRMLEHKFMFTGV